jgi:hypothetical protein
VGLVNLCVGRVNEADSEAFTQGLVVLVCPFAGHASESDSDEVIIFRGVAYDSKVKIMLLMMKYTIGFSCQYWRQ